MEIIKKIENKIITEYGRNTLNLIQSETAFTKAIEKAIRDIESERRPSYQLITNKSAFNSAYYKSITVDVSKVQEQIRKELVHQLYTKNMITESEYKKICPTP